MIVDFHTYVGESMLGQESTEEDILKNMEENQVDVSVICPVKTIDPSSNGRMNIFRTCRGSIPEN